MKRKARECAFTLIEVLSVVSILSLLVAIMVPVVVGVKRRAKIAVSISNLRQAHMAMLLYSIDHEPNAAVGSASDMGLPDIGQVLLDGPKIFERSRAVWQSPCGQHPEAPRGFTNLAYMPENDGEWVRLTERYGAEAVWLIDWNCTPHEDPLYADFMVKTGIAVRGSGSVTVRRHYGGAADCEGWWH